MIQAYSGIIVGGAVQLDERIDLADQCRVQVTIVPLEENRVRCHQALAALEELRASHPLRSGGSKYTREQLHERS
jgi:hypothetical protein